MPPSEPAEIAALLRAAANVLETRQGVPAGLRGRQLVTLDQCAVMVCRSTRCLRSYSEKGLPPAATSFRRGQPKLYDWDVMRPWLEATFGILLPEKHPAY